jgi:two-component system, chemotaxis family, chemotaxis protein CheY
MTLSLSDPVLIVDDLMTMQRLMANLLRSLGFTNIEGVSDGTSALERIREVRPTLVLLDLKMQPMSGLEVLRAVRSDPQLQATKVIVTTATRSTDDAIAVVRARVNSYLLKPFSALQLRERLTRIYALPLNALPIRTRLPAPAMAFSGASTVFLN